MTYTDLIKRAKAVLDAGKGMTPGPWTTEAPDPEHGRPTSLVRNGTDEFGYYIATTWGGYTSSGPDARAIAATPEAHAVIRELLEENERLLARLIREGNTDD